MKAAGCLAPTLWGILLTALLVNDWSITLWFWGIVIGGSVLFGFYSGIKKTREQKRLQKELEADMKFNQYVLECNMQAKTKDPKHRYSMTVIFDDSDVGKTTTANDIETLHKRAEKYNRACFVEIRENMSVYPEFDWVTIEEYHLG